MLPPVLLALRQQCHQRGSAATANSESLTCRDVLDHALALQQQHYARVASVATANSETASRESLTRQNVPTREQQRAWTETANEQRVDSLRAEKRRFVPRRKQRTNSESLRAETKQRTSLRVEMEQRKNSESLRALRAETETASRFVPRRKQRTNSESLVSRWNRQRVAEEVNEARSERTA